MPTFRRDFDVAALAAWDQAQPGNAVRALFERWALPGESGAKGRELRVGIRDGYLNLYVKGQSVAKLKLGRDGPSVDVHEAYAFGRQRSGEGANAGQRYVSLDAAALASPDTTARIAQWATTAETYASAEKRFVDDLIAANPGVIDLEMGLPASDEPDSPQVAPRMDLVVCQTEGGTPAIAFWEAKCANNPELRTSGDAAPKVLGQLDTYQRWMTGDRVAQVQEAYRQTATVLLALCDLFRPDAASDCVAIWRALAAADAPGVIVRPGIVVGNYWPDGSTEQVASQRMAQAAASFARNGHRDKIAVAGVTVHEVGPSHHVAALPRLTPA